MPARPRPARHPNPAVLLALAVAVVPASFLRSTRRRFTGQARELLEYRSAVAARTSRIDAVLGEQADTIDALRRHAVDVDDALDRLVAAEEELDALADELREMAAPEDLHELHLEYEANLERALRGIVTAERGCGLTKQRHRPPEDDEPPAYWKRGQANVTHARLRMEEITTVLLAWEPGRSNRVSVAARLER
jgi:hypothetical protein